jgi:hypothetical protein
MNKTTTLGVLLLAALTLSTAAAELRAQAGLALAFEETWEPRSPQTGVFGVVSTQVLEPTPDGSDPQQAFASNDIRGKWGTLRTLDGSVPGLPDVTGLGPNPSWMTRDAKLYFHAAPVTAAGGESTGGFALISQASFPRSHRIVLEADLNLTHGSETAFAGVALIAGEGDYRELALYRRGKGKDTIDRVAPLRSSVLAKRTTELTRVRIEYDPVDGFGYFINGRLAGREAIDHQGASFAADPHVGLYFTGNSTVPGAFVEGFVGPVRVWVQPLGQVASTGAPPP